MGMRALIDVDRLHKLCDRLDRNGNLVEVTLDDYDTLYGYATLLPSNAIRELLRVYKIYIQENGLYIKKD